MTQWEVLDVTVGYGRPVPRGVTAVLGPSVGGKTTLLKVLAGLPWGAATMPEPDADELVRFEKAWRAEVLLRP